MARHSGLGLAAAIGLGLLVAVAGGSVAYWFADGAPGTPQQFKERVAEAGLDVEWSNVGPRGGDGSVDTDCGNVEVSVTDLDGDLWLAVAGDRQPLSAVAIDDLLSCSHGSG